VSITSAVITLFAAFSANAPATPTLALPVPEKASE
jgi:hypothetical protein